ncbi:MAG TPA: efflux RND transporter periplasmic adaptor subunit [Chitinophagaceae bacterium]|jgi:membrane fusion protein (multidrug efflux system)|nr:efflux RND transporter periplasmic adaptor subunit [Chitinophagaceae bacterium]
MHQTNVRTGRIVPLLLLLTAYALSACSSSSAESGETAALAPALPVLTLTQTPATVYQEYSASLEGTKDIEIRPQVEGTLEQIYVDEGAPVRRGQVLFRVNDRPYREQLNQARAALAAARAQLVTAQINVSKIAPLVQNNVVSDIQLKSAQAAQQAAVASVAQAQAAVRSAEINLGYTTIKAPADGYIGRIPYRTGSLVGLGTPEPLTLLSEIRTVYAYFSLSENDFMRFKEQYPGATIEAKVKAMPPVELLLPDGSLFPQKGKVEVVSGQFDGATGSITFRAAFPNTGGGLRSGNTGKVRLPLQLPAALAVPQEATYELQDKVFVFKVADSNKVVSTPLTVAGRSGNYYLVQKGVQSGDRIVFSGLDRLREGTVIQPLPLSADSLRKAQPL